jgi:hypothetical protein
VALNPRFEGAEEAGAGSRSVLREAVGVNATPQQHL